LNTVNVSANGKIMVAGVDNDQIYISKDYGVNWSSKVGPSIRWGYSAMSSDAKYIAGSTIIGNDYLYLFTSPSRLSGKLTVTGNISSTGLVSQAPNYSVMSLSANQTFPAQTDTVINFTVKDDPNGWFSLADRAFKPTVAGYFSINCSTSWTPVSGSTEQINTQIRKNNNTIAIVQSPCPTVPSRNLSQTAYAITYLNGSTDKITVTGYSGDGQSLYGETNGTWTKAEIIKIS